MLELVLVLMKKIDPIKIMKIAKEEKNKEEDITKGKDKEDVNFDTGGKLNTTPKTAATAKAKANADAVANIIFSIDAENIGIIDKNNDYVNKANIFKKKDKNHQGIHRDH